MYDLSDTFRPSERAGVSTKKDHGDFASTGELRQYATTEVIANHNDCPGILAEQLEICTDINEIVAMPTHENQRPTLLSCCKNVGVSDRYKSNPSHDYPVCQSQKLAS
ncbi:MAG: hypothetical protein Q7S81_01050 [bacterium]|nr:hypothetical protein [bacterium]